MSGDTLKTVLFGPEEWGFQKMFGVDSTKPAPIPKSPEQTAAEVQAAEKKERAKLTQGKQGTIFAGGVINPSENDQNIKRKVLLGG
jgi:hypothetical protein